MMLLMLIIIILCIPFLKITTWLLFDHTLPHDYFDKDGNLKLLRISEAKSLLNKQKIRHIFGYIITILFIVLAFVYINLLAAYFSSKGMQEVWIIAFLWGLFDDWIILQPLKGILVFACLNRDCVDFFIELLINKFMF